MALSGNGLPVSISCLIVASQRITCNGSENWVYHGPPLSIATFQGRKGLVLNHHWGSFSTPVPRDQPPLLHDTSQVPNDPIHHRGHRIVGALQQLDLLFRGLAEEHVTSEEPTGAVSQRKRRFPCKSQVRKQELYHSSCLSKFLPYNLPSFAPLPVKYPIQTIYSHLNTAKPIPRRQNPYMCWLNALADSIHIL